MTPGLPSRPFASKKRPCPMINRYVLMGKLGKGTFGTVRCAVDVLTMTPYAVKLIDKVTAREKLLSFSVRKEVAIMQSLQHPNVVKLVGVYSDNKTVYIVMNLVTGGELFREVKRLGRMSEPYARFFFQQLVRGLEYCHNRGVFHRDLKPENLLLDTDNTLKITDFGLSTLLAFPGSLLAEEQLLQTRCGTPHYVAPEILTMPSEGYDGSKTDVWSCGVILYVLVGGGLPFDDHTTPDSQPDNMDVVFRKIIRGDIMYPRHFSDDLVDLLENIFKEDPKDRFGLKDIGRHPWFSGMIVTQENEASRPDFAKLSPGVSEILEKNIEELMPYYDRYKRKAEEKLIGGGLGAGQHAVNIIRGPNGLPLPTVADQTSLSRGQNASIDSLALGSIQESREVSLQCADMRARSSSSDIADVSSRNVQFSHIRCREDIVGSDSSGSYSSEDDNVEFDSEYEFGNDPQQFRDEMSDWEAGGATRNVHRSLSAGIMHALRCETQSSIVEDRIETSCSGMSERSRVGMLDCAGLRIQSEIGKPVVQRFVQNLHNAPLTPRSPPVWRRPTSFAGPFPNQQLGDMSLGAILSRRGRMWMKGNVARHCSSVLATAPVVFASREKESPSYAPPKELSYNNLHNSGHEWRPFKHHDILQWCRVERDYDMIPDLDEFGCESCGLSTAWKTYLEREICNLPSSARSQGCTTFHLSRSSVDMLSPAWRKKSRQWKEVPAFWPKTVPKFTECVRTNESLKVGDEGQNSISATLQSEDRFHQYVRRESSGQGIAAQLEKPLNVSPCINRKVSDVACGNLLMSHSRSTEQLPSPPKESCNSTPHGQFTNSPRQIATGPLRKGYGSGGSERPVESVGSRQEQAELNAQNLFRLAIPGPGIRPRLPDPRPFSKVLKPTKRIVLQLCLPRIPFLCTSRSVSFNSLLDMQKCNAIVTDSLETQGCTLSVMGQAKDKFRTRLSVKMPNRVLSMIIFVSFREPGLTKVSFQRKDGSRGAFLELFNRVRERHALACTAENGIH